MAGITDGAASTWRPLVPLELGRRTLLVSQVHHAHDLSTRRSRKPKRPDKASRRWGASMSA
eukprot:2636955-Pyramimonas_sp.AAC.1